MFEHKIAEEAKLKDQEKQKEKTAAESAAPINTGPEFRDKIPNSYEELDLKDAPADEGLLMALIGKLRDKLAKIQREKFRKVQESTPEGQRAAASINELYRIQESSIKAQTEAIEAERHRARRELALELFGEKLLREKKFLITNEDPRLNQIILENRRLEHAKAKFEHEIL